MTMMEPAITPRTRYFPSRIALLAAAELVLIALLLRLSNSPAFFAAAIACSLCSIQLGVLLINRFQVNTRRIRKVARQAEFSTQAVLITDSAGQIKWTNPQFTRLTGYYVSEIAGKTFGLVLHGQQTSTQTVDQVRRHMRMEQPFDVEIFVYNRAGEGMWVTSKGDPVRDTRGNLTHYVITQTDISDQHRLNQITAAGDNGKTEFVATEKPVVMLSLDPLSQSVNRNRATQLSRKLESLGATDDRLHLQHLVDGLKARVEECVISLPAPAIEKVKDHSSNQQNEG